MADLNTAYGNVNDKINISKLTGIVKELTDDVYEEFDKCKDNINNECDKIKAYFQKITVPEKNDYYKNLSVPFGNLYNAIIPKVSSESDRILADNNDPPISYANYIFIANSLNTTMSSMESSMSSMISFYYYYYYIIYILNQI